MYGKFIINLRNPQIEQVNPFLQLNYDIMILNTLMENYYFPVNLFIILFVCL